MEKPVQTPLSERANHQVKGKQGGTPEQHALAGRKGGLNSTGPKKKAGPNDARHNNPGRPRKSV